MPCGNDAKRSYSTENFWLKKDMCSEILTAGPKGAPKFFREEKFLEIGKGKVSP
jgi:hypothetical protein